jgi:hypothetical protein
MLCWSAAPKSACLGGGVGGRGGGGGEAPEAKIAPLEDVTEQTLPKL